MSPALGSWRCWPWAAWPAPAGRSGAGRLPYRDPGRLRARLHGEQRRDPGRDAPLLLLDRLYREPGQLRRVRSGRDRAAHAAGAQRRRPSAMFRTSPWAQQMVEKLRRAQVEAEVRCF